MSLFLDHLHFRGATGSVATFDPNTGYYQFKSIQDVNQNDLVVIGLNPITNHVSLATVYCNIGVEFKSDSTGLHEVFKREDNNVLTLLSDNISYAEAEIEWLNTAKNSQYTEPYLSIGSTVQINNLYFQVHSDGIITKERMQDLRSISKVRNTIVAGEQFNESMNKVICASSFLLWQLPRDASPMCDFLSLDVGNYIQVVSLNSRLYNNPFWTDIANIRQIYYTWMRFPTGRCIIRQGECQVYIDDKGNIVAIDLAIPHF